MSISWYNVDRHSLVGTRVLVLKWGCLFDSEPRNLKQVEVC
jgi:hypothetical protein